MKLGVVAALFKRLLMRTAFNGSAILDHLNEAGIATGEFCASNA